MAIKIPSEGTRMRACVMGEGQEELGLTSMPSEKTSNTCMTYLNCVQPILTPASQPPGGGTLLPFADGSSEALTNVALVQ